MNRAQTPCLHGRKDWPQSWLRCLILNVRDNILNYDRQLAFSDLDWLWGESRRARAA